MRPTVDGVSIGNHWPPELGTSQIPISRLTEKVTIPGLVESIHRSSHLEYLNFERNM